MKSFGLVLGAGGDKATAFHAGVLSAIASDTGWDPRTADVLIGTSAGSTAAATLRAGISADDLFQRAVGEPMSAEGQAIADRVVTKYKGDGQGPTTKVPGKPLLAARSLLGGFRPGLAFAGAVPRGTVDGSSLAARINEMHDDVPWPDIPTWLVGVRQSDGKRIVFGRDDVKVPSIGKAVQASTAVPGTFVPVSIAGHEYVDGAVHSTTNADLLAGLGLDGVVISSAKSIAPNSADWKGEPTRTYFRRTLQSEIDKIQKSGTPVLVVEPDAELVALMEAPQLDTGAVAAAAAAATMEAIGRSKKVAARLRLAVSEAEEAANPESTDAE